MTNIKAPISAQPYVVQMETRDHECDVQGVVNNANYQHYFEHARHRFLLNNQIDFAQLAQQGINLMVAKIEIEYKAPLKAHDQFLVNVTPIRVSKLKVCFVQELINFETQKLMALAKSIVVTVNNQQKPMREGPLNRFA